MPKSADDVLEWRFLRPVAQPPSAAHQEPQARTPVPHVELPDISTCLHSGQAFGWRQQGEVWTGTVRDVGLVMRQNADGIFYTASTGDADEILEDYFALDEDPRAMLAKFPQDDFLRAAVEYGRGLRILRQDPWECLAGFILSSTKQIVHIRQIWMKLCEGWGKTVQPAPGRKLQAFPTAEILGEVSERELRGCGMGFRAPWLKAAATAVATGVLDFSALRAVGTDKARERLMELDGVGRKIADCVLLFSLGKGDAFPIDTWMEKVLKQVYLPRKRRKTRASMQEFAQSYFGVHAGLAQQYLFHFARMNPEMFKNSERFLLSSRQEKFRR